MSVTDGALPGDVFGRKATGVYAPNTGVVALQSGTVSSDGQNQPSAPAMVQTASGSVTSLSATNSGLPVNIPAIVQKANAKSTGSVASLAAAFTSNNTAGNTIVVQAGCGNGTAMTVADSAGNTYVSAIAAPNSTTFGVQIFYAVGILSGANTVTVTNAGTTASMAVEIYEVSGLLAQVPGALGETSIATGTSATPTAANISGPPNSLAFMCVGVGTAAQASSVTAGTFWNLDSTQNTTTPAGLFSFGAYNQPLAGMRGVQPAPTIAGSEPYALAAAVFKPVAFGVEGTVTIGGYNYTHVTSAATTLVKTGPGVLHAIVVNKPTSTATIEADDAITNTTPVIAILGAFAASIAPFSVVYDVAFTTGLSVTVGVTTVDATIVWR